MSQNSAKQNIEQVISWMKINKVMKEDKQKPSRFRNKKSFKKR